MHCKKQFHKLTEKHVNEGHKIASSEEVQMIEKQNFEYGFVIPGNNKLYSLDRRHGS